MNSRFLSIILFILGMTIFVSHVDAGIVDGLGGNIPNVSIQIGTPATSNIFDVSRDIGLRVLTAIRLVVSGFALIYLVLI